MAQKRGNGNGSRVDPSLTALNQVVVAELRGLREDTNAQLESLRLHVDEGFARVDLRLERVDARLERVEERLENIRDFAGEHHRTLEARVAKLEQSH